MHPIFIFHTIPCVISEKTLASLRYAEVFLAMLTQFLVPSAKKRWLRFAMPKFSSQFLHNSLCHHCFSNFHETGDVGTTDIIDVAIGLSSIFYTLLMDGMHDLVKSFIYFVCRP